MKEWLKAGPKVFYSDGVGRLLTVGPNAFKRKVLTRRYKY
jgi:hypothetical protein